MIRDMQKIHGFLMGRNTIQDLWIQFDTNFDAMVDMTEFRELLYHSHIYFLRMQNPLETFKPTQESIKQKLDDLSLRFNKNRDKRICESEFKQFGDYLQQEKLEVMRKTRVTLNVWRSVFYDNHKQVPQSACGTDLFSW